MRCEKCGHNLDDDGLPFEQENGQIYCFDCDTDQSILTMLFGE